MESYPFPRRRPQLGAKPVNISINAKLSVEREPVIGQTLIDMRGRKPAWEGISPPFNGALVSHYGGFYRVSIFSGVFVLADAFIRPLAKHVIDKGIF